MLRLQTLFFPLLLLTLGSARPASCAAISYDASKYNLDSLCYISTDVVEVSLVRHPGSGEFSGDTFTASVVDTLGGDYKIGEKINLPYPQVVLSQSCSLCILFIARKHFQLDMTNEKSGPPDVAEVLPVDALDRVHRYSEWQSHFSEPSFVAEDDPAEPSYPLLANECQVIKSRWIGMGQIRPLLSRALRPEDAPAALSLHYRRQQYRANDQGTDDIVNDVVQARLADLHDPTSHQADAVVHHINVTTALGHIICGH